MMHGLVHDSAVVGTVKRMNHRPRRARKQSATEGVVLGIAAIFAAFM